MSTQPIYFDSTETGAPSLTNGAGSLIDVIASCLVDGFNVKAIGGIVVASGVATVTCATHGYASDYGKLVEISGASTPLLNGRFQPTSTGTNTFTVPAPGVADGSYTATSARRAPAGWTQGFRNATAMRITPGGAEANPNLSVIFNDLAGATSRAYLVNVLDGAEQSPTTNRFLTGGYYWRKQGLFSPLPWFVVADDMGFYIGRGYSNAAGLADRRVVYFCGYPTRFAAGHSWGMVLTGDSDANISSSDYGGQGGDVGGTDRAALSAGSTRPRATAFRDYMGTAGTDVPLTLTGIASPNGMTVGSGQAGYFPNANYPNQGNAGLLTCPVALMAPGYMLGLMPGLLHVAQFVNGAISPGVIDGTDVHAGKKLLTVVTGNQGSASAASGAMFIDITGPWAH